ncbi:zinc ribbon domain-containing protein [Halomicroarcula sp. F13]|uniref:Zinc ribbon domain-containing protein n=1 Tax=Haloarcula rubra TaxID=2487747 RepID=A0AAW4PQ66_9EURY|nr:zinc ribbon domain-containing protein [Halomicroarcula rubra]MBX0322512.1 zinc ribbon domain-containing protein [Halomicroarcula rubra]
MAIGQLELAFRVASGLFVIVAPTVMFLALWRGLEAMRDDELIERAQQRAEAMEQSGSEWSVDATAVTAAVTSGDPVPDEMVACPSCGTANRAGVTYCQQCLHELDD